MKRGAITVAVAGEVAVTPLRTREWPEPTGQCASGRWSGGEPMRPLAQAGPTAVTGNGLAQRVSSSV